MILGFILTLSNVLGRRCCSSTSRLHAFITRSGILNLFLFFIFFFFPQKVIRWAREMDAPVPLDILMTVLQALPVQALLFCSELRSQKLVFLLSHLIETMQWPMRPTPAWPITLD